jgi:ubiquinone/menaquinone biosynthesis C-methylase UbiE
MVNGAAPRGATIPGGGTAVDDAEVRQRALYDQVAGDYDEVFPSHVSEHYRLKRAALVRDLLPPGGQILDVGCGTGHLAAGLIGAGYRVAGIDLSPGMVLAARTRGVDNTVVASASRLPFGDHSFDLVLTVATLHHLETEERVGDTIAEMGRVVRPGGFVVLWDHNPSNPYWPLLMSRVPQDSGQERLVPMSELLADVQRAGLSAHRVGRSGFMPDFLPRWLASPWRWIERAAEAAPGINRLAAHNVVVARKA